MGAGGWQARLPGRAVVDRWAIGGSYQGGGCWVVGGLVEMNGEGEVVEVAGNEGAGEAVDKAVDAVDERPAKDGVDGDSVPEGNANGDGASIGASIWDKVRDNGSKDAVGVGIGIVFRVGDGAGEADGVKWGAWVVKFDEGFDAGRVEFGEVLVVGVEAAIEAGAGVKKAG